MAKREGNAWAVVLAAGEGSRLAPLTCALYGENVPKQFAAFAGRRSLLQETVARVGLLVPAERTVVVVSSRHRELARRQLADFPGIVLVAQPRNLGTGPGILLPLAHIRARHPGATVAVFPCDQHFRDARPMLAGVRALLEVLDRGSFAAALLGVEAARPETDCGWIEPGAPLAPRPLARIERFVEKPSPDLAACLHRSGALWNTLICVARLAELWSLIGARLPAQAAAFEIYGRFLEDPGSGRLLDVLYEDMEPANLSHDVLTHASDLAVLPVSGTGFSDWGTPERVLESLEGTRAHAELVARLSEARARPVEA